MFASEVRRPRRIFGLKRVFLEDSSYPRENAPLSREDREMDEVIFHRLLLSSDCTVADPASADVVFVPYYGMSGSELQERSRRAAACSA